MPPIEPNHEHGHTGRTVTVILIIMIGLMVWASTLEPLP